MIQILDRPSVSCLLSVPFFTLHLRDHHGSSIGASAYLYASFMRSPRSSSGDAGVQWKVQEDCMQFQAVRYPQRQKICSLLLVHVAAVDEHVVAKLNCCQGLLQALLATPPCAFRRGDVLQRMRKS